MFQNTIPTSVTLSSRSNCSEPHSFKAQVTFFSKYWWFKKKEIRILSISDYQNNLILIVEELLLLPEAATRDVL